MSEYVIEPTVHRGRTMTGVVQFEGMPAFGGTIKVYNGVPYVEIALDEENLEINAPDDWQNRIVDTL